MEKVEKDDESKKAKVEAFANSGTLLFGTQRATYVTVRPSP